MTLDTLLDDVRRQLEANGTDEASCRSVLDHVLASFDCAVGTLHRVVEDNHLELIAQRGVPDSILPQVRRIPIGKGMAGLAAERREPVQVCNLQKDTSGVAKPAAKDTKMEGSVALPMIVEGELRGTLGVGKPIVYEFTTEETERLLEIARLVGTFLESPS